MINLNEQRFVPKWEHNRKDRLELESKFSNYTGNLDIVEFHIPYTRYEFVSKMLNEASSKQGKKILVSGGDSVNFDVFSFFWKTSHDPSCAMAELEKLINVLRECERVYDQIVFISTNHERRLYKVLEKAIAGKDQVEAIKPFIKTFNDFFKESKLKKVVFADSNFIQLGDSIISHMENNSAISGSTRRWLIQYFAPRVYTPFNVIYGLHTHCQGQDTIERVKVIETGCIAETMDYWRSGKMNGRGKMSSIGYASGYMKNGLSDLNRCNPVFCGWEGYI